MGLIAFQDDQPFAPEANREIVKRLQEIDSRLNFIYLPIGVGCWAITEKWSDTDPRRARIRSGDHAPNKDFDILGFAPPDATADDALDLLLKRLRQRVTEAPEYDSMMQRVIAHNAAQKKSNAAPMREFAAEMISANEEKLGTKIISRGAGFGLEDGKLVGTPRLQKLGLTKSEREAKE